MKLHIFKKLLKRYSTQQANEAESDLVDSWYESFGDHQHIDPLSNHVKKRGLRNSMHAEIIKQIDMKPAVKHRLIPYLKFAAGIVLAGTVSLLCYFAIRRSGPEPSLQIKYTYISAGAGKMKRLILPDSSELWLNTGSRIHYQTAFTAGKLREVVLDQGEVFFSVKPDKLKPFIVQTGTLRTRVLGTSFNIRSYKEISEVKVTVLTGRVQVSHESHLLGLLTPGQEIVYNRKTQIANTQLVNATRSTSWIDGKTYLRQAMFSELALIFKHRYGILLKSGNERVENYRYSIQLDQDTPIENIVKAICSIHQSKYRRHENEIVIY